MPIGRNASGKDTLRVELERRGLRSVRSMTDHDPRPGEVGAHISIAAELAR